MSRFSTQEYYNMIGGMRQEESQSPAFRDLNRYKWMMGRSAEIRENKQKRRKPVTRTLEMEEFLGQGFLRKANLRDDYVSDSFRKFMRDYKARKYNEERGKLRTSRRDTKKAGYNQLKESIRKTETGRSRTDYRSLLYDVAYQAFSKGRKR